MNFRKGFTIVELAIVISVIGILASVTVVFYNGAQQRAEYSRAQTDMRHINDSIDIYRSQTGSYPTGNGSFQDINSNSTNAYTVLVNGKYIDEMPSAKTGYTYQYRADNAGVDYKLLRIKSSGTLNSVELSGNNLVSTTGYNANNTWGYWSSDTSKAW
jgi:general secretion pathway protein G